MDFVKVFDQTVREIRREVNLKVLKVPEIEQKVLDATSSEPWGPHGSALLEISQATQKFNEWKMVMNVLWTRLKDTGSNWRHVYKTLAVIEYLIANGSERALENILEHTFQISSLSEFEYLEPNGKDVGINVRKKVETIMSLLHDKEKIKAVRDKAAANRDKYVGLSSSGITFKSSSKSYDSYDSYRNSHYGSIGGAREGESFRESYKDSEDGEENGMNTTKKHDYGKEEYKGNRDALHAKTSSKPSGQHSTSTNVGNAEDELDDFDPRGAPTTAGVATKNNKDDLFGESLLIDLMDVPASLPLGTSTTDVHTNPEDDLLASAGFVSASIPAGAHANPEDDLFAGASFVSASIPNDVHTNPEDDLFASASFVSASIPIETSTSAPAQTTTLTNDLFADATFASASNHTETSKGSITQDNVDLFAGQSASPVTDASSVDLFAERTPEFPSDTKSNSSAKVDTFDPFVVVPINKFDGSDMFGDFSSSTGVATSEEPQSFTSNKVSINTISTAATKPMQKKDAFQVKSGIWADSLSRGLIDLNITASKKVTLAEIGIVGDIGDESSEKGPAYSPYIGNGHGARSGWGRSDLSSTTMPRSGNFSGFGQDQSL